MRGAVSKRSFLLPSLAVLVVFLFWGHHKFEVMANWHDFYITNRKSYNTWGCYWCHTTGYPTNTTYVFAHHIWFYHYGESILKDTTWYQDHAGKP